MWGIRSFFAGVDSSSDHAPALRAVGVITRLGRTGGGGRRRFISVTAAFQFFEDHAGDDRHREAAEHDPANHSGELCTTQKSEQSFVFLT
jgi:hypothetical protein